MGLYFRLWDLFVVTSGTLLEVTACIMSFIFRYWDLGFVASKTCLEVAVRFVNFVFRLGDSLVAFEHRMKLHAAS